MNSTKIKTQDATSPSSTTASQKLSFFFLIEFVPPQKKLPNIYYEIQYNIVQ